MATTTAIVFGLLFVASYLFVRKRRPGNLPPGPKGIPILGNALQIPLARTWLKLTEWADQFGDVVYLEAAGRPIVVLNSVKAAHDLLDKREFAERPHLVMAGDLCEYDRSFSMRGNDAEFKAQRRLVTTAFAAGALVVHRRMQEREGARLALDCIQDPTLLRDHIQLRIGRIIEFIAYGHEILDLKDPVFSAQIEAMEDFIKASSPGAFLVDALPFLRYLPPWLPGAGFRRQAVQWKDSYTKAATAAYDRARRKLGLSHANDNSLCGRRLLELEATENSDPRLGEHLKWATMTVMGGGMDTKMSAVLSFFKMMVLHPAVQVKARQEIDNIVGRDRLPVMADIENLPYVRSVITEVLRTGPPGPLGLPHSSKEWYTYGNFAIPPNAIVIPNIWRMLRDPNVFADPTSFNPDRYAGDDEKMRAVHDLIFGFGRRACPGMHLAIGTLSIFTAILLSACEILPAKDGDGNDILPGSEFTSGSIVYPEPFPCVIRARSLEAHELLKREGPED